jgi:hypothetical protein
MPSTHEIIVSLSQHIRFEDGKVFGKVYDPAGEAWKLLELKYGLPPRPDGSLPVAPLTDEETAHLITEYLYGSFYVHGVTTLRAPQSRRDLGGPDVRATFEKRTLETTAVGAILNGWVRVRHRTSHILAPAGLFTTADGKNVTLSVFPLEAQPADDPDSEGDVFAWAWADSYLPGGGSTVRYARFYFHFTLQAGSGASLAKIIKETLDARGIPFRLKYLFVQRGTICPEPVRRDTAVLYASIDDFVPVVFALREIYPLLNLTEGVTLFVRPFANMPGLSFAEDPADGESFGKTRLRLIAGGILATRNPDGSVAAESVPAWVAGQGYNLDAFYLEPKPALAYDESWFSLAPLPLAAPDASGALQKARQVGDWLCREAIWLPENRCNWVGARANEKPIPYAFLDDGWPTGRLGIALFLAALARYTDSALYAYVANGAIPDLERAVDATPDDPTRQALLNVLNYTPTTGGAVGSLRRRTGRVRAWLWAMVDGVRTGAAFRFLAGPPRLPTNDSAKAAYCAFCRALRVSGETPVVNEAYWKRLLDDPHLAVGFEANQWGIDEFVPGINGLTLLGFGFLRTADRHLPALPCPVPDDCPPESE